MNNKEFSKEGPVLLKTESPLDRIPLYGRGGTILPLGPKVQHTGELSGKDPVEKLMVFGFPADISSSPRYSFKWSFQAKDRLYLEDVSQSIKVEAFSRVTAAPAENGLILIRG